MRIIREWGRALASEGNYEFAVQWWVSHLSPYLVYQPFAFRMDIDCFILLVCVLMS
jgi:hypothetical protein